MTNYCGRRDHIAQCGGRIAEDKRHQCHDCARDNVVMEALVGLTKAMTCIAEALTRQADTSEESLALSREAVDVQRKLADSSEGLQDHLAMELAEKIGGSMQFPGPKH